MKCYVTKYALYLELQHKIAFFQPTYSKVFLMNWIEDWFFLCKFLANKVDVIYQKQQSGIDFDHLPA